MARAQSSETSGPAETESLGAELARDAAATATWCSCAASSARARRRSCAAPRGRWACTDPVTSPTFSIGHRYRGRRRDRLPSRSLPARRARRARTRRCWPTTSGRAGSRSSSGRRRRERELAGARLRGDAQPPRRRPPRRSSWSEPPPAGAERGMIVLGFDTATAATAVALRLARRHRRSNAATTRAPGAHPGHATRLLAMTAELLGGAGVGWSELERIAVGARPGHVHGSARRRRHRARARPVAAGGAGRASRACRRWLQRCAGGARTAAHGPRRCSR